MGRRGWTRLGLVGAVLIGVVVGARLVSPRAISSVAVRAANPRLAFPISGFGGYQWTGRVTQIASTWRVPPIDTKSPSGSAATWIGAQSNATNQFIQVGVFEQSLSPPTISYRAFWSDGALGDLPQWIGEVHSTDNVTASLVQDRGGWTARFIDQATGLTFTKSVAYGAGTSFTTGEWLQEDPIVSSASNVDGPYPDMASVSFQRLQVAGRAPSPGLLNRLTLTTAGGLVLVPTGVHHDAFTFSARGAPATGF